MKFNRYKTSLGQELKDNPTEMQTKLNEMILDFNFFFDTSSAIAEDIMKIGNVVLNPNKLFIVPLSKTHISNTYIFVID